MTPIVRRLFSVPQCPRLTPGASPAYKHHSIKTEHALRPTCQARQGGAPFRLAAQVAEDPLLLVGRGGTGKTFLLMHGVSVDRNPIPRQAFLSNHVTKRC